MADQRALANLLRLGSAQREDALLQAQMAQAAQMAQPRGRVYGTAGGAIMGGLSDGLREMGGGFRQNDLVRQAKEAMAGEVDARQQWIMADAQKRAAARAALLRGQQPPAGGMPLEQPPQEQAAGMAAALRRQAVEQDLAKSAPGGGMAGIGRAAPDALTQVAPHQPGALLGGGASGGPETDAGKTWRYGEKLRAYLATPGATYPPPPGAIPPDPSAMPDGQFGRPELSGEGVMASAPVAPPATPTGKPLALGDSLRAKMSTPSVAPPAPVQAELPDLSPEQYAEIAIASGDPAMMAWGKTVLDQANMRETLAARRQEQEAKTKGDADAAAAKQKSEADKFGHDQAAKFMKQPVVEAAQQSRLALEKIKREAQRKTAFGDVAMVYGVITTFDPKSGVKEGEVALAEQAKGVPSYVVGLYNRAVSGQRLTDEQRADILAAAENMYQAQAAPALRLADYYAGTLSRAGLDPAEYLPDLSLSSAPKAPKAKAKPPDVLERGGRQFKRLADGTYEEIE